MVRAAGLHDLTLDSLTTCLTERADGTKPAGDFNTASDVTLLYIMFVCPESVMVLTLFLCFIYVLPNVHLASTFLKDFFAFTSCPVLTCAPQLIDTTDQDANNAFNISFGLLS